MSSKHYRLQRDYRARSRLNFQHWAFKHFQPYTIHSSIALGPESCIIDVGSGTGAWLFGLATQFPRATPDGIDVELDQCLPAQWLPENVKMHKLNIYDPIPAEFQGKYDLVHVRLFSIAVHNQDPTPVIEQLKTLAKDGGHIQWTDADPWSLSVSKASDELESQSTQKICDFLTEQYAISVGGPPGFGAKLPEYFQACGLEDVKIDKLVWPRHALLAFYDDKFCAIEELSNSVTDPKEILQMVDDAVAESRDSGRGVAVGGEGFCIVGKVRKS